MTQPAKRHSITSDIELLRIWKDYIFVIEIGYCKVIPEKFSVSDKHTAIAIGGCCERRTEVAAGDVSLRSK